MQFQRIFHYISMVVTICTGITMVTPTQCDNIWLQKVNAVLNVLAGNVLCNANADAIIKECIEIFTEDDGAKAVVDAKGAIRGDVG